MLFQAFADDNHVIEAGRDLDEVKMNKLSKIEEMTNWLIGSGLSVNESKT